MKRPRLPRRRAPSLAERYHSPIPNLDELDDALWERPSPLRGVDFDLDAQVALFEDLADGLAEYRDPPGFELWNRFYESVDAEVLWAMVRRLRPRRVVELGSGWSSLVLKAALEANGDGAAYEVYDPYPRGIGGVAVTRELKAQEVPDEVFAGVDLLFVDTSHTVKTGGDVNHIVLDVLPQLGPGAVVHFHDVLLPWEIHRVWLEMGWYWAEQYLLQAFLSGNRDWRVLLGVNAVVRARPDVVERLVPSFRGDSHPSAFWIERVGAAA